MSARALSICVMAVVIGSNFSIRVEAGVVPIGGGIVNPHVTDGSFGPNEWTGPTVSKSFFPVVGNSGGAYLYADQGVDTNGTNLYLMYDYTNSNALGLDPTVTSTSFDVFFTVGTNDYVVQMGTTPDGFSPTQYDQSPFLVYEKDHSLISPLNPDGSLNLQDPVWTLLNPGATLSNPGGPTPDPDFPLGRFQAVVGFGPSPDNSTNHLLGEFQLSVNTAPPASPNPNGLYSPAPAFWSASAAADQVGVPVGGGIGGIIDPPISSGIFSLSPDGTTTVIPALGADGGPALQPQDVVPEPSSWVLLGLGAVGLVGYGCARKKREITTA